MHRISRDTPCYYLTSVPRGRLPIFRTDKIKIITCNALDEARNSGGFALYAYAIMLDHLHVITDSARFSADTLRFINGIIGRRVIDYLKQRGYESSLLKLRRDTTNTNYLYSLWDHHPNVRLLFTEKMLMSGFTTRIRIRFGRDWYNVRKTTIGQVFAFGMESPVRMSCF